jgi:hypothetical protein
MRGKKGENVDTLFILVKDLSDKLAASAVVINHNRIERGIAIIMLVETAE